MSERSLAIFLHRLLEGQLDPAGPVGDSSTLMQLVERPAPPLQALLGAHVDGLLAAWPGGPALRPAAIPAPALWAGAALNNLAWSARIGDPRLLTATLRLAQALPPATTPDAALAYHSLLRHLDRMPVAPDWLPVTQLLLQRSPLTAAWLPQVGEGFSWPLLVELLDHRPIQVALRDRMLGLLPPPEVLGRGRIETGVAAANAEVGRLLSRVLEHGGASWQPFVLAFYEADCDLQRRGDAERPTWPLLDQLRAARLSDDPLLRRNAQRLLARYRPLAGLLLDERLPRPYMRLEGRFLEQIGALLPPASATLKFQRVSIESARVPQ